MILRRVQHRLLSSLVEYQHVMSVINADSLAVASYNCDGVTSSTGFINNLLSDTKIDILCLQETWLLDRDIAKLSNIHADYQFNGKSGVDATERILPGRPQGGVAIAWHKGLSHYVKPISYFQQAYVCNQNATECS